MCELELLKENRGETEEVFEVWQNSFEFDENYKTTHPRSSINPKHKEAGIKLFIRINSSKPVIKKTS